MTSLLTVGHDFEAWPAGVGGGQVGESSPDQHAVHEASVESGVAIGVDVRHRIARHLPVLVHRTEHAAPVLSQRTSNETN